MKTQLSCDNVVSHCFWRLSLISGMTSFLETDGVNIVLAAVLPKDVNVLTHQFSVDKYSQLISDSLQEFICKDERLQFFFDNSSTVVCDELNVNNGVLEIVNPMVVNLHGGVPPVYRMGGSCASENSFVLFGFYAVRVNVQFCATLKICGAPNNQTKNTLENIY
jgi:hypothetical protein